MTITAIMPSAHRTCVAAPARQCVSHESECFGARWLSVPAHIPSHSVLTETCPPAPQLLELQRVSSRLQGILQEYHATFDLDILEPVQFARGVIAAHPYFLNPMMLGGNLGA